MQLSQYTASVRPRYLMLLSVMLAQTVIPHSVQQMSMMFSLYVSFCFHLVTIRTAQTQHRHRTRENDQSVYRRCLQRLHQTSKEIVKNHREMHDILVIESICRVTVYMCATVGTAFSGSDCAIVPVNRASCVGLLREGVGDAFLIGAVRRRSSAGLFLAQQQQKARYDDFSYD